MLEVSSMTWKRGTYAKLLAHVLKKKGTGKKV
jgi:hypothetical protein